MKTQLEIINKVFGSIYSTIGQRKIIVSQKIPITNSIVLPIQTTEQEIVILDSAFSFAILAGSGVRNTGKTIVTGDIGISPGSSVGGFPSGRLIGHQQINNAKAQQAKQDLITAYNDAASRTCTDMVKLSGNIGGLTLTPGLYRSSSSLAISSDDLTFDALGDSSAIFIIQIATTLIARSGRKVILKRGALASNIFWQVGDSATFETASVFKGTILAMKTITFKSKAKLFGRALTRNGAVVVDNNAIVIQE